MVLDIMDIDLDSLFNNELSSAEVLVGLLDYGLFAEKVPPCFVSEGLSAFVEVHLADLLNQENESKLKKNIDKRIHSYIRYEALRDINIPRHLGIPHPESYAVQALAISKHWSEINAYCGLPKPQFSRVHVRHVGGGRIFEMNYKGDERYQHQEEDIQQMAGANFVVKADIAACFPSIYTHSIPWALHSVGASKNNKSLVALSGNLLDKCTQISRDGQTNGLLIGSHASNIISEIILISVDKDLSLKGHTKFNRHIDDYEFFADSYETAERFIKDLGLSLRKYELSLNEKKTRIVPLPRPSEENWWQELNRFKFPDDVVRFSTVRSFLDLALEGAQIAGTSATLNYAIKVLSANFHNKVRPLNERAKRLYVQEVINLALLYPYLAPILDEFVFEKYSYIGIKDKIVEFVISLVDLGLKRLYPDAIAHALYYALKYKIEMPNEDTLLNIIKLDDCLTNVLLLEYANKYNFDMVKKAVVEHAAQLKKCERREIDKQWLLIYQVWTESDLKGNKQDFLAELKKSGFQFLSLPES